MRFTAIALLLFALPASAQRVIYLVRHAERLDASENSALSEVGSARAEKLAEMLKDAGVTAVFTSELLRAIKTAQPLADKRKLKPIVVDGRKTADLVARLKKDHADGRVLIVGHSNTVPELLAYYGVPKPERGIAKVEGGTELIEGYDNLFVLLPKDKGPPLVLRVHY